jgi:hypothetical protein
MLRSIEARSETSAPRDEGAAAVLILRDARTPVRICGRACAFALLRMRTAITNKSYSLFKQPSSFPRRVFAPGFLPLCFARPDEGVAERRETYGCLRGIRWACTIGAGQAPSEAPCVPIRGTPASRRSHRGDFGLRGRASPHRHCGRIGHSKLPHPGRSARRGPLPPGAAVANRRRGTPRLAPPSGCLRTTPLEEQGWEDSYYTSQNAVN